VTERSAVGGGGVDVLAALESFSSFGSNVDRLTEAMLVKTVPFGVPEGMPSVNVKPAELPAAIVLRVHVMVPPEPTPGVRQTNAGPLICDAETNVIPAGMGSVTVTSAASSGPMLNTVTLYATLLFAAAVLGPLFATPTSASCAITLGTAATRAIAVERRATTNIGTFAARIAEGHRRIGHTLQSGGILIRVRGAVNPS
jgi:hypothetical protein